MEMGKCPKCGGYNLKYGVMQPIENSIYYPWECEDCGASGKEYYDLIFSEQELDAEGGE